MSTHSISRTQPPPLPLRRRITRRGIAAVAQRIAAQFQPEQIILFGSYAYGRPRADSDVDLLIVMNTKLRERQQAAEISIFLFPYPFPMDIFVETPNHLKHRIKLGDPFFNEIVAKGKVLYAHAHT